MAAQWSTAPAPTLKGKGAIITGLVLLGLGIVLAIVGIVGSASSLQSLVSGFSSPRATPTQVPLTLDGGTTYAVYEQASGGTGVNGDPFTGAVAAEDVTITGPSGTVPFVPAGSSTESFTTNGTTFVVAGTFDPPASGSYTVAIATDPPVDVVVAPSLTSIGRVAGWIGLIGLGALLGLAGLITLIVGLVRRSSSKKAVAAATAYAAQQQYAAGQYSAGATAAAPYGQQPFGTRPVAGPPSDAAPTADPYAASAPSAASQAPQPAPATPPPSALPPAGWYPDPAGGAPGAQRYWDGSAWTEHRA